MYALHDRVVLFSAACTTTMHTPELCEGVAGAWRPPHTSGRNVRKAPGTRLHADSASGKGFASGYTGSNDLSVPIEAVGINAVVV